MPVLDREEFIEQAYFFHDCFCYFFGPCFPFPERSDIKRFAVTDLYFPQRPVRAGPRGSETPNRTSAWSSSRSSRVTPSTPSSAGS